MNTLTTLVQSLGIAYASGISPYATVALAGIADRMGWIDALPGALDGVSHPAVIVLASTLTVVEFRDADSRDRVDLGNRSHRHPSARGVGARGSPRRGMATRRSSSPRRCSVEVSAS